MPELAVDEHAEKAVIGSLLLRGDIRDVGALTTRGLRPEHFYWRGLAALFTAAISLSDRHSALDSITLLGELDRLGIRGKVSREQLDLLKKEVPSGENCDEYADIVMEKARWRQRNVTAGLVQQAVDRRDPDAWKKAVNDLDAVVIGARTDSYSAEQWADLMFDHFSMSKEAISKLAIPLPWRPLNYALGGGIQPGEVLALGGPTGFGKSIVTDQVADHAAKHGKAVHIYMTEMTALIRGMRYLSRRTGVPFMAQRRNDLSDTQRHRILDELKRLDYGVTIAADWDVDDIVRDALRARYGLVVVDLLHGFHYADERDLDRLSKAMQRLARVSTTIDGHPGTAVIAATHLKEEGMRGGKVPRPTIASIKGGSSIKQDADFVCFVWQEQDEAGIPTGEGEIWLAKSRSGELDRVKVLLNSARFRFDLRVDDGGPSTTTSAPF